MSGQERYSPQQAPQKNGGGSSGGAKKRALTLSFSPAQLISSIAGLGIVLVWVFILGVILGRGYAPEAHIPELDRLMPKAEGVEAPRVITPDIPQTNSTPESAASEVIQPGDMAYRQSLKNPSGQPSGQRAPAAQTATQPTRQTTPAAQQNAGQSAQQSGRQNAPAASARNATQASASAQSGRPAAGTAATQAAQAGATNSQVFTYVYQVAAYKDQASCDALTAKLQKAGFSASTEKSESNGSTWYKTLISFKGTPDDVDGLRARLSAHKLDRLIMRSKTPAR